MALNTDFDGTSLPAGWTFVQNQAANATHSVSGGFASITIPSGQVSDSISSTSSPDNSAGFEHAISGDFDVAVRVATMVGGQSSSMLGFILRGATTAETIRWSIYGNISHAWKYGYSRTGGVGTNYQSAIILRSTSPWFYGHPSWIRAKRVGSDYTFYLSSDGVNWNLESSVTTAVAATTLKLKVAQYSLALGLPVRYDKVVDLLALGGTDARAAAVTTYQTNVQTTTLDTLPAWLALSSAVDGSAAIVSGGAHLSTAPANQSGGRLTYVGAGYANAGMLMRVRVPVAATTAYGAFGLGVADGGPNIDQYSAAPLYGVELHLNASAHAAVGIRVCRPHTWNELDESYTFTKASTVTYPTGGAGVGTTWWRIEKFGPRLRMRFWDAAGAEPSTWWYDGEDDMLAGLGNLVPYMAVSHNDGATPTATMSIEDLSFYELVSTVPFTSSAYVGATLLGDGDSMVGALEADRMFVGSNLVYGVPL